MALAKQLQAVQGFLRGIRALSTYEETRERQFQQVERSLRCMAGLTTAQAGAWMESLEESLWSAAQVAAMKELVVEKTEEKVEESGKLAGQQDYTALPYLLSEELWTAVEDRAGDRDALLRRLCLYAAALGLRNGTEGTKATLVALAHWCTLREGASAGQQYELYVRQKWKVTRCFQGMGPAVPFLAELPLRGEDVPVEWRPAHVRPLSPARQAMAFELGQFVKQMPLRKDHRALQGEAASSAVAAGDMSGMVPLAALCQVVSACAGIARREPRTEPLPLRGAGGQLMIEDGRVESQEGERSPSRAAAGRPALRFEADLEALRGRVAVEEEAEAEVGEEGEEAGKEKARPAQAKRRAAKKEAKAKAKAKAKPKGKAKAAARQGAMKRPAKKPTGRTAVAGERSALRESLLQHVPAALKRRFAGGCSTCRYRPLCTMSCWAKRGFVP